MTKLMPNDAVQEISPNIAKKLSPLQCSPKEEVSRTNSENYLDKNNIVVEKKELMSRISRRHKTQT
jgi:hypothetical protein